VTDVFSPWWYRRRDIIIFAIYVAGFLGGDMLWRATGASYVETGQWLASFLGARWLEPIFTLATLAMIGCFAIRTWGASYLSASVVWNPDARTDALLVDGPFRFLRNPLYLGNVLMAFGFGMLATPYGFAIIGIGHAIFLPMLAGYEAKGLREKYGAVYTAYARAVPAILPRLTPAHVAGSTTGTPSLAQGFKAEIFSGACAVAMILLVTVRWDKMHWIFLALVVGGFAVQRLTVRRAGR
jgi:protein-S-isoprenylcysteine O-methyltransferase Ste14